MLILYVMLMYAKLTPVINIPNLINLLHSVHSPKVKEKRKGRRKPHRNASFKKLFSLVCYLRISYDE